MGRGGWLLLRQAGPGRRLGNPAQDPLVGGHDPHVPVFRDQRDRAAAAPRLPETHEALPQTPRGAPVEGEGRCLLS